MQIKCPYYKRILRSKGLIGVVCDSPRCNLGFDTEHVVTLATYEEQRAYLEIFCEDLWGTCPYAALLNKGGGT